MNHKTGTHAIALRQKQTLPEHEACDILQRRHLSQPGRRLCVLENQMALVHELPARTLVQAGWLLFAAIQVPLSYDDLFVTA